MSGKREYVKKRDFPMGLSSDDNARHRQNAEEDALQTIDEPLDAHRSFGIPRIYS